MKINVKRSTIVKPMAETPGGSVWLSNLDLLMPPNCHTPALYLYRSNGAVNFFDPTVLKAALSRALVDFYPYAGRLKRTDHNRLEIDCNAEGVLFVEAESDSTVDDFGDFSLEPDHRLFPAVDYSKGMSTLPIFLVQLTRFKCGGISLGIVNEHHVSDGPSCLHFIKSWSHLARGRTIDVPPIFDRTLLSARDPPSPRFHHAAEYPPRPEFPTPDNKSETTSSMFRISRDQLNALVAKCKDGSSTYEVVAGHVWRCMCMARGLPKDELTKVHVPVDGRSRLRPPLPPGFFGNVIFSAAPTALSGEIVGNPVRFAVEKVQEAIGRMDDEYLRSALDYLELLGDVSAHARGAHTTRCPNLGMLDWARLPIYDADFGWGKPVYCGPGLAPGEGKSILLASPENDGSLLYGVTLLKQHMKLFHKLLYTT